MGLHRIMINELIPNCALLFCMKKKQPEKKTVTGWISWPESELGRHTCDSF